MCSRHWWDRIHVSIISFVILVLPRKSIWSTSTTIRYVRKWRHSSIDSVRTSCQRYITRSNAWKSHRLWWNVYYSQLIIRIYLNWTFSFRTKNPSYISMVSINIGIVTLMSKIVQEKIALCFRVQNPNNIDVELDALCDVSVEKIIVLGFDARVDDHCHHTQWRINSSFVLI